MDVFDNGNTNSHKKSAYDHILFPSNPGIIHGLEIRIPKNISKHLTLRYGEGYMQKCASPFWDHKNEKGIKNAKINWILIKLSLYLTIFLLHYSIEKETLHKQFFLTFLNSPVIFQ